MPAELSAATYARRIERRWCELLEQPVVLSPRDWSLLNEWHERGIPLQIVVEAMQTTIERSRTRGRAPRTALSSLSHTVEDAWGAIVDGRRGGPATFGEAPGPTPRSAESWRRRAKTEGGSALGALLTDLLRRLDRGAEPVALDAELDRRIAEASDPGVRCEIEREIERQLDPHRSRLSAAQIERTRARALVDRIRGRMGLARLA
jgi:hypothetical protein